MHFAIRKKHISPSWREMWQPLWPDLNNLPVGTDFTPWSQQIWRPGHHSALRWKMLPLNWLEYSRQINLVACLWVIYWLFYTWIFSLLHPAFLLKRRLIKIFQLIVFWAFVENWILCFLLEKQVHFCRCQSKSQVLGCHCSLVNWDSH